MKLRCNLCGSNNVRSDSDGTIRCVHCGSANIEVECDHSDMEYIIPDNSVTPPYHRCKKCGRVIG